MFWKFFGSCIFKLIHKNIFARRERDWKFSWGCTRYCCNTEWAQDHFNKEIFYPLTSNTDTVKHFSNRFVFESWLFPHSSLAWQVYPRRGYAFWNSPIHCLWIIKTDKTQSVHEWWCLCEANGPWRSSNTDTGKKLVCECVINLGDTACGDTVSTFHT